MFVTVLSHALALNFCPFFIIIVREKKGVFIHAFLKKKNRPNLWNRMRGILFWIHRKSPLSVSDFLLLVNISYLPLCRRLRKST